MPLHMTKIAFSAESPAALRAWLESHDTLGEARLTTRYLPKRHEEMVGGSLYWIYEHALVGRSPILGFEQREDGRWHIRLEPMLIPVVTHPKRAHQGWRYLAEKDAPRDLGEGETAGDAMPPKLARELAKLGLV
ncbi:hypothetical protein EDF58_106128 [Novosphingobium sp. PhB57]|jgi:hypothetical protein|uniref:DUF1489 family protein n=1 Tax=unclassified Novosphingobium TaxID=2644732 RepID=UPI0010464B09|nr:MULTISPECIES: DUF1489 domain-containing protein [unclassified Novosphingobium]TCU55841.1 hypothetical protein EDF58_106128 [Novosphingobium sp. PhB57]TDW64967.1 hypothetical protein EDF57_103141 [Novosphingobium sp. PhB55]